jgi:hypothetical protein
MIEIFSAMALMAPMVSATARPPSAASRAPLTAICSVCFPFSALRLMEALICSRLDVVSCTEAACSLVPCERLCDDADTWFDAPLSAFAPARTSPITWASLSNMATKAWPKPSSSERGLTRTRRSPAARRVATDDISWR